MIAAGCGGAPPFEPLDEAGIQARKELVANTAIDSVTAGEVAVLDVWYEGKKPFHGTITFEFLTNAAPNHSANFKRLANAGFYDGTTFHRVIPGFMIQGGDILSADADPGNDGTGNPGYQIEAEFSDVHHAPGIVSMARSAHPHSAGSQFFICHDDAPHLDRQYSAFGRVIDGMELVDQIANVPRGERDMPLEPVRMLKVRVVTQ
jgi:peptidyl-prolyl cis-trans isomerase B (cyclophilin B)